MHSGKWSKWFKNIHFLQNEAFPDPSEVIKEFQCKDCKKILGSRPALQRHSKEVHQKHTDGQCSKCGKKFQNKSNLKIHMLTHSGIKPFK